MNRWRGWAAFGATLMIAIGIFQILSGIFGLLNDQWIVLGYSGYSFVDVTGLAVWYIALGAVLFLGGIAVFQGSRLGRVVGVIAAALGIISQLLILPIHPVWSIVLIILFVMSLIAFVKFGGPVEPANEEEAAPVEKGPVVAAPAPMAAAAVASAAEPAVTPEPAMVAEPAEVAAPVAAPVAAAAAVAIAASEPAEEEARTTVSEPGPAVAPAAVAAAVAAEAAAPAEEERVPEPAAAPVIAAAVAPTEDAPAEEAPAAAPVIAAAPAEDTPAERRAYDLTEIEGIGAVYAAKLGELGLKTTDDLLKVGANPKGREDLAFASGISGKLILRWVNMADLFRVKGVGEQYADLLEAAGVDTVPELAQRRADNLTVKMVEVNEAKNLVRRLPTEGQVAQWVEIAKGLPRAVTY
jgi:predicted flap endonuclease-1-like 5' DNA nuclease